MSEAQEEYITDALAMIGAGYKRQVATEVSGFIPVFDVVAEFYNDHMTALVFGRMWNYCGMSDGVCKASLDRLAGDLRISRATVIRHIEKLCVDGFMIDKTPNRRNRPHEYMDGGKVVMKGSFAAGVSQSNSSTKIQQVYQKDTATVSERYLIKQDNTNIKQDSATQSKPKKQPKEKPATHPNIMLYREVVSRYPTKVNYDDVTASVDRVSARLGRDAVKDDLIPFYKRWCGLGYNPFSLSWLEWAVDGKFPENGLWKPKGDTGRSTSTTLVRDLGDDN